METNVASELVGVRARANGDINWRYPRVWIEVGAWSLFRIAFGDVGCVDSDR